MTEFRNLEAYAFCLTVDTIRKAKGKPDPKNLPEGTLERRLAEIDEINDTLRMLGIDPTDLNAPPSAPSIPPADPLT